MLDFSKYQSIGAALKDALDEFANEVCLIESDRDREKERLTCRDFKLRDPCACGWLRRGWQSSHIRRSGRIKDCRRPVRTFHASR